MRIIGTDEQVLIIGTDEQTFEGPVQFVFKYINMENDWEPATVWLHYDEFNGHLLSFDNGPWQTDGLHKVRYVVHTFPWATLSYMVTIALGSSLRAFRRGMPSSLSPM